MHPDAKARGRLEGKKWGHRPAAKLPRRRAYRHSARQGPGARDQRPGPKSASRCQGKKSAYCLKSKGPKVHPDAKARGRLEGKKWGHRPAGKLPRRRAYRHSARHRNPHQPNLLGASPGGRTAAAEGLLSNSLNRQVRTPYARQHIWGKILKDINFPSSSSTKCCI